MKKQWVNKNVNLTLLSRFVEGFFKERGFRTKVEELSDGRRISITSSNSGVTYGSIDVDILGELSDLVIEFKIDEKTRLSVPMISLSTFFGGGGFILQKLKAQEAAKKLEREFWAYVDELIADWSKKNESFH